MEQIENTIIYKKYNWLEIIVRKALKRNIKKEMLIISNKEIVGFEPFNVRQVIPWERVRFFEFSQLQMLGRVISIYTNLTRYNFLLERLDIDPDELIKILDYYKKKYDMNVTNNNK